MKQRIFDGDRRHAGHEYSTVEARTRSRVLRGWTTDFGEGRGRGFWVGRAGKVNERAVLEVSVASWETAGLGGGDAMGGAAPGLSLVAAVRALLRECNRVGHCVLVGDGLGWA